jgi:hypothetical protein
MNALDSFRYVGNTARRRITVLSSLDEIFTYQLGIMEGVLLRTPHPFLQQASGQIFKDDRFQVH